MTLEKVDTIADGTRTDHAEPENFKAIERLVDELVTVEDEWIKKAMVTPGRFGENRRGAVFRYGDRRGSGGNAAGKTGGEGLLCPVRRK